VEIRDVDRAGFRRLLTSAGLRAALEGPKPQPRERERIDGDEVLEPDIGWRLFEAGV
jgi:hypothetical protein